MNRKDPGEPAYRLQVGAATHVGLVRESNEDSHRVDEALGLFVIADGMGGHRAGDVASRIAVETIVEAIRAKSGRRGADEILPEALEAAHRAIRASADADPSRHGMGTTAVLLWIPPSGVTAWVAHVGDSRAYLFREGRLERLTQDHTLFNQVVQSGLLPSDPADWPPRHALSQSLGAAEIIAPEVRAVPLQDRDVLLLCSDGLTDMLEDEDIGRLLSSHQQPQAFCDHLIEEATRKGGRDNITIIGVGLCDNKVSPRRVKRHRRKTA